MTDRVVGKLGDGLYKSDKDMSTAKSAFRGLKPTTEDFEKKLGEFAGSEPVMKRALMRINHPLYQYQKN